MLPRINHHFHTARGGQDLSKRFSHTPNVSKASGPFVDARSSNLSSQGLASDITVAAASRLVRDGKERTLFHGVKVPKKPAPPAEDDCCMSGCAVCVYDIYMDARKSYRSNLSSALVKLESLPESRTWTEAQWPPQLRELREQREILKGRAKMSSMVGGGTGRLALPLVDDLEDAQQTALDISMKAFEALERSLKDKS